MRNSNERGIAMITTLLVLMLISALLVGFTTVVMSDQRFRFIDHDRGAAFYAASGGVEKLTVDLGNQFFKTVGVTGAMVTAMTATTSLPVIGGITYTGVVPGTLPGSDLTPNSCNLTLVPPTHIVVSGTAGYTIQFCSDASGNPTTIQPANQPIKTGPYAGLLALQTPYQLDVTARTSTGGEAHLARTIEAVAIPVFQFGMFSDVDLSFSAAENFSFGGRVQTNGNLYLAEGTGSTLTMTDKVTAVKEVVRQQLSNGVSIDTVSQVGTLNLASSASTHVALVRTAGSVVAGPTSAFNEPTWHTTSLSTYNGWLRNGRTGAKTLSLPLVMPGVGGTNPDLVRRPVWTPTPESTTSILYNERLMTKSSIRILLSDTQTDITSIPGVISTGAVQLEGNWNVGGAPPASYGTITSTATLPNVPHPPLALMPGYLTTTAAAPSGGNLAFSTTTAAAVFKPTFIYSSSPANTISCTGKSLLTLTGCTGSPSMPGFSAGGTLTQISPATSTAVGASASVTAIAAGTITMATNPFNPLPFWNTTTNTFVTCTGYTTTTYTGCSSVPANGNVLSSAVYSNPGISPVGGWIKIERQNTDGSWHDVTMEILNYGIGWNNDGGTACSDPTQYAIIRLQRLRDNQATGGGCNYNTDATGFKDPTNWWPMALFDTREGVLRDSNYPGATLPLSGVIYYVAIDVGNLAKWFQGTTSPYTPALGGTGTQALTNNGGFTVYFSDRRNNRNLSDQETAEFGWEDFINPGATNYAPNGALDTGEDVNGNGTLDTYGGIPNYNGVHGTVPPCTACPAGSPLKSTVTPVSTIQKSVAQVNRAIFFRHALMLMDGGTIAPAITGLTVVAENPVYIRGDYNCTACTTANFTTGTHAATSVIADAVTILSNTWIDGNSMDNPYDAVSRPRPSDNFYRTAIISGKSMIFPKPNDVVAGSTFGTDGGAHSFLRMLEGGAGDTVHYRGSMATFFYSRQAVGTFKCCGSSVSNGANQDATGIVYGIPTRDFTFDTDFLTPTLLPPNTPVFRDMNSVGFSQELRPGK